MKHHWFKLVMNGRLHIAPIGDTPGRILDLGTGTGIWCVEMGDKYPSARIIGTDLSKIQPTWVPPNVSFEIDDFDDEWTYGDGVFDLVHNRFNTTAVNNWPRQFRKAFDALKPGGFIEVVDITNPPQSDDGSIPGDSSLLRFFEHLTDGCKQVGRDLRAMYQWRQQLEEAGYVNIQERVPKVPMYVNRWAKGFLGPRGVLPWDRDTNLPIFACV